MPPNQPRARPEEGRALPEPVGPGTGARAVFTWQETLATALWVEEGTICYRVPPLEAALANRYGAMLTPARNIGNRGQDAVDYFFMVAHSTDQGRQPIDLDRLALLGEKVWAGGGAAEILRLVEEVKQGSMPTISPPKESRP